MSAPSRPGPNELRSTWPQRAWTLAGTAAIISSFLTCIRLLAASGSTTELLAAAAAAFAAYSLADLATGVYHWFIDNYGDASTPVFGPQIAAFQGHHRYPSTITLRELCNNLHALARAVVLVLIPVDAALSARDAPAAAHAFFCAFAAFFLLSQQFHAWAHERRRRLPPGVEALQAAGVLVSRAQHAAHHRQPYWISIRCSRPWRWSSSSAPASARGRGTKQTRRGRKTPVPKPPPPPVVVMVYLLQTASISSD
jgi:ubiquitin-conjugating enzyme E2 variant